MSVGTVYQYFPTKEALARAIVVSVGSCAERGADDPEVDQEGFRAEVTRMVVSYLVGPEPDQSAP